MPRSQRVGFLVFVIALLLAFPVTAVAQVQQPAPDAGNDDPSIPRFTDNGDGTVTDNLTGSTWSKSISVAWLGKSTDELVAKLGRPTKTTKDGRGGKIYIYRLDVEGEGITTSAVGSVGGESVRAFGSEHPFDYVPPTLFSRPETVASISKIKLKFHVDPWGTIYKLETEKKRKGPDDLPIETEPTESNIPSPKP